MVSIAQACRSEGWPARISCVISNRPDAPGLAAAQALDLDTEVLDHRVFGSRDAFEQALMDRIDRHQPDLVVLAGFMRILGGPFVNHYRDRLINIHPSLLPAFPGLHTHEQVLAAGCKVHGTSVHFVTAELDAGPLIAQAVVPVLDEDTPDSLRARVQQAEHRLYPAVVRWLATDRVRLHDGITRLLPGSQPEGPHPASQWHGSADGH